MLPTDAQERKEIPIYSGFFKYFPHAIAAAAQLSFIANKQHNPGEPLHWAKEKSADEQDAQARHILDNAIAENGDAPLRDKEGVLHAVKNFWRAGAHLERLHDAGVNIFAELPGKFDHCPDSTTFNDFPKPEVAQPGFWNKMSGYTKPDIREPRDAGNIKSFWTAQFLDMANDASMVIKSFGPFEDRIAAHAYITENPRNIVGIRSIQEVNYPS